MRFPVQPLLLAALCASGVATGTDLIPWDQFTLANGLQVIVHEDHKAPIVAVQVVYRVGSKDEQPGKTGFAHLFEHLLFKGSENFRGDYFQTLADAGASDVNAVTTYDTTTYHETVPTPALELVLWLESDRMGHFRTAITQAVLDAERGVVQNEKLEREGGPLGSQDTLIREGVFPHGHPYRSTVMGSMADLSRATLPEVQGWFTQYYGASNAIVVLSGDIDIRTARSLMEKYFGDSPPGEPVQRITAWIPERTLDAREVLPARVTQAGIQRAWAIPGPASRDYTLLNVAARVLSDPIQSRLRDELVTRRKLATAIGAFLQPFEMASVFTVAVDLRVGADRAELEKVLDLELARFLREGPSEAELLRSQNDLDAVQIWGLQSVSAKSSLLASAAALTGDPGFVDRSMAWARKATRKDIMLASRRWLSKGYFQLTTVPFGNLKAGMPLIDRARMPPVDDRLALDLPPMQEATLSNGMSVVLAERHETPTLNMTMVFPRAGRSADQGGKTGRSATTFTLMRDGPTGLTRAQYARRLLELHASVGMNAGVRDGTSSLSALKQNLPAALQLWQRALREPAFRAEDMERWRESLVQSLDDAEASPDAVASQIMAAALFPAGHPYTTLWDAPDRIQQLQRSDAAEFHARWVRPDNVKLFVVGDTNLPELRKVLEKAFAQWKAPATSLSVVPQVPLAPVPSMPRFILLDWPGERQTRICAGRLVIGAEHDDSRSLSAANDILGGGTSSRLGSRVRGEKGWTYGIGSVLDGNLTQQYWGISTQVQGERTVEAIAQILEVLEDFRGRHPGTSEELSRYVKGVARNVPGSFEDAGSVLAAMVQSDAYGHPYDWAEGTKSRLDALTIEDVNRVARDNFTPESLTWVLVGDLSMFERKLRAAEQGKVEVWDRAAHRTR